MVIPVIQYIRWRRMHYSLVGCLYQLAPPTWLALSRLSVRLPFACERAKWNKVLIIWKGRFCRFIHSSYLLKHVSITSLLLGYCCYWVIAVIVKYCVEYFHGFLIITHPPAENTTGRGIKKFSTQEGSSFGVQYLTTNKV